MLSWPRPTHSAFITPVWSCDVSRAMYMKRQMTDAPTSEIAIGMKINDLAVRSSLAPSESTAMARPSPVARNVTVTAHHRLFEIVPRRAANSAKEQNRPPKTSGGVVELPISIALPVAACS